MQNCYIKSSSLIHEPNQNAQKNRRVCLRSRSFRKKNGLRYLRPILLPKRRNQPTSLRESVSNRVVLLGCLCIELGQLLAFSSGCTVFVPWGRKTTLDGNQKSGGQKPVEVGTLCHYFLQGFMFCFNFFFIHPRILSGFLKHQQYEQCAIFSAWGRVSSQKVNGSCSTSCNDLFERVVISSQTSKPLQRRNKNSHRSPDVSDKSYQAMMQLA